MEGFCVNLLLPWILIISRSRTQLLTFIRPAAMSAVAMALASLPPYCIGKFILRNQLEIGNLDATGADHCVLNFGEIFCFSLLNLGATKLMDGKVILPQVRQ